jgi:uncharacterized YigZ family protein
MNDLYKTIASPSEGLFREKGSRFISFAYPVENEAQISQQISGLKKQYYDARHHCFAWRLGADMEHYRANDDGEPSGSAGKPILGQIQSRDLTQILVVVVRYFGGTLLGVGGLIRAYRSAASDALDQAMKVEKKVESQLVLQFGYHEMNAVMKVIKEFDLDFEDQQFDLECTLTVRAWIRSLPRLKERLSTIDGCRVTMAGSRKL